MFILKEFRDFAIKGNVIDLAVGVIIGAAFSKIVDSMVNDIIMPLIALLIGGKVDFSNLYIVLGRVPFGTLHTYEALKKAGVPMFAYGNFLTITLNFILLAFAIFLLVKYLSKVKISQLAKEKEEAAKGEEVTKVISPEEEQVALLKEIRDSLNKQ